MAGEEREKRARERAGVAMRRGDGRQEAGVGKRVESVGGREWP